MNQRPLPPALRFLVDAERSRPDAPPDAKAMAAGRLAALLGPGAGLGAAAGVEDARVPDGGEPTTGSAPHGSPASNVLATGAKVGAAKLIGALALGGVLGGGIAAGTVRPTERIVYVDRFPSAASGAASVTSPVTSVPLIDVSSLPPASPPGQATRPATLSSVATAAPSARARDTDLSAERTLLERARSALARGDGERALAAVAQHEREFPNGQLTEEREVVAVQALVMAGRVQEAAERGARFRKAFPNSLLLPVVDQVLR